MSYEASGEPRLVIAFEKNGGDPSNETCLGPHGAAGQD